MSLKTAMSHYIVSNEKGIFIVDRFALILYNAVLTASPLFRYLQTVSQKVFFACIVVTSLFLFHLPRPSATITRRICVNVNVFVSVVRQGRGKGRK